MMRQDDAGRRSKVDRDHSYHLLRNTTPEQLVVGFLAAKGLGTLAGGFLTRLGELLAESTSGVLKRLKVKAQGGDTAHLRIDVGGATTTVVFSGELSDEARLALIELDPTAEGVRGRTLVWDADAGAWRPLGRSERPPGASIVR